ncbi:MAG: glycosyltransferase [Xanthobacteraceae bacterium]|nr:glycosyltransferase [Xanthobacteraceae bacterium]
MFAGEDQGRSRYTGELWDQISETGTADVVRLVGTVDDMPAAYAAATVAVSAAVQAEGLQRAVLEAQAMARPVAGVRSRRRTRCGAGAARRPGGPDDGPAGAGRGRGRARGRPHSPVLAARAGPRGHRRARTRLGLAHFKGPDVAQAMLALYAEVARPR